MNDIHNRKEDDFSLYTEKIEPKPSVKYRRFIRWGEFVLSAILFGAVACVVMLLLYPALDKKFHREDMVKEQFTIEKDEYPNEESETVKQDSSDWLVVQGAQDMLMDINTVLQHKSAELLKSMVTIDVYKTEVDSILSEAKSDTDTSGLVIGDINEQFIILTNYMAIKDAASQVVKFSAATEVNAELIGKDASAGIALLSVKKSDIPSSERASVVIAQLGNSYNVKQGDLVIVAGKLFGNKKSVNYGTISAISTKSGIDNAYGLFYTGIVCEAGDYGYLFNLEGNVVGVSYTAETGQFTAIGISDLKYMIQELSNEREVPYCGIRGQNITSTMATAYGLPMGIYITEVELDSPAYQAGLQQGDVITSIDGNMVLTIQTFSEKLYQYDKNTPMTIYAKRLGKDGYKEMEFSTDISK